MGLLTGPNGKLGIKNGKIAIAGNGGTDCCCDETDCCCKQLWGRDLTATIKWGCPGEPPPHPEVTVSLPWDDGGNYWHGDVTGFCTDPPDFTVEVVCAGVMPPSEAAVFPLTPDPPDCSLIPVFWTRIRSAAGTGPWYSANPGVCLDYTYPAPSFTAPLTESSCCTVSPGSLQSVRIQG